MGEKATVDTDLSRTEICELEGREKKAERGRRSCWDEKAWHGWQEDNYEVPRGDYRVL
jgi:hypothetical protein